MKDFSKVLILSDFDGTLRSTDKTICKRNVDAIEYFKKNGGHFGIASGRADFVLEKLAPEVKTLVNSPCIVANGSYMYDFENSKRLFEIYTDEIQTRNAVLDAKAILPDVGIRIIRDNKTITPEVNKTIEHEMEKGNMENTVIYDFDTLPSDRISKVTFILEPDQNDFLRNKLEEKYGQYFAFSKSWTRILEFQDKNATKGSMLKNLKDNYYSYVNGLKVYGVGDYENDIPLLKAADFACCPDNALDMVKEMCDYKLCSNNDGCIGDLIERLEKE